MKKIPLTDWIDVFQQLADANVSPDLTKWANGVVQRLKASEPNPVAPAIPADQPLPAIYGVPWFSWATTNSAKADQLLRFYRELGAEAVSDALRRAAASKPSQLPANWVGLALADLRRQSLRKARERQPELVKDPAVRVMAPF